MKLYSSLLFMHHLMIAVSPVRFLPAENHNLQPETTFVTSPSESLFACAYLCMSHARCITLSFDEGHRRCELSYRKPVAWSYENTRPHVEIMTLEGDHLDYQLRLVGGDVASSGRVEVMRTDEGIWGTVCDQSWSLSNGHVVCRMLGYVFAREIHNAAQFGQGTGDIYLKEIACSGSEAHLIECNHTGWENDICSHDKDAGVTCETLERDGFQIRLVNGEGNWSGRVEVMRTDVGLWGTVCDDGWDINDGHVVCRMLGYPSALWVYGNAHFGQGTGNIYLDDVQCRGKEANLIIDCSHRGWGNEGCIHGEDAGVSCETIGIDGFKARLVNGEGNWSGRVEVMRTDVGTWGTVCDDGWDINDGHVVCRMLGYPSALRVYGNAHFGQGTGDIYLDDVQCSGNETNLIIDCNHKGWGIEVCNHGEDAGVSCETIGKNGFQARLVNGQGNWSGRLEVMRTDVGTWGTVCDDDWDINDGHVVCRMLGYMSAWGVYTDAHFGEGTGDIYLDDVHCSGYEANLISDCYHNGWGNHDCEHNEDAGVKCNP